MKLNKIIESIEVITQNSAELITLLQNLKSLSGEESTCTDEPEDPFKLEPAQPAPTSEAFKEMTRVVSDGLAIMKKDGFNASQMHQYVRSIMTGKETPLIRDVKAILVNLKKAGTIKTLVPGVGRRETVYKVNES